MNERAAAIVDRMVADAVRLRIRVHTIEGGATVIDAGVEAAGGYEAGIALSEICMGGLGSVSLGPVSVGDGRYPGVAVVTDHPAEACMASQYAGWAISVE